MLDRPASLGIAVLQQLPGQMFSKSPWSELEPPPSSSARSTSFFFRQTSRPFERVSHSLAPSSLRVATEMGCETDRGVSIALRVEGYTPPEFVSPPIHKLGIGLDESRL